MVSVAPLDVIGDKRSFIFRSEPSAELMVIAVADMVANGVKTVGWVLPILGVNSCSKP